MAGLALRAVMLAAGVGERLDDTAEHLPKALLEFGGRSLLARHIAHLRGLGVECLSVVVGYRADTIRDELAALEAGAFAHTIHNPAYREGSIASLWAGREALTYGGDVLLMDADVLYDPRVLARLVETGHESCFLMDRGFEDGDEPVRLCLADGRPVEFRKAARGTYDMVGESVGFFRFSAPIARAVVAAARAYIDGSRREVPYEEAIRDVLLSPHGPAFGYEDVTGLPWIEIDFPHDVARARAEILPRIEAP